ncbi:hypothetical protein MRX96_013018 [Rhipicephalus microplus]
MDGNDDRARRHAPTDGGDSRPTGDVSVAPMDACEKSRHSSSWVPNDDRLCRNRVWRPAEPVALFLQLITFKLQTSGNNNTTTSRRGDATIPALGRTIAPESTEGHLAFNSSGNQQRHRRPYTRSQVLQGRLLHPYRPRQSVALSHEERGGYVRNSGRDHWNCATASNKEAKAKRDSERNDTTSNEAFTIAHIDKDATVKKKNKP